MTKNKRTHYSRQSDKKANQSSVKEKIEKPQIVPVYPIPNQPTIPAEPDEEPDHTRPEPEENDPQKNDPTRIDEEPPIFNNYET
ncbi:MAG: hypothetical protein ACERKD_10100 [Prolixibacteraceae bacterium]